MKYIIRILTMVLITLLFSTGFLWMNENQFTELRRIEPQDMESVFLLANTDDEKMYEQLLTLSNKHTIDIYRTKVIFNMEKNKSEVHKYLYVHNQDNLMYHMQNQLSGQMLTAEETRKSEFFLSTINTQSPNQIGQISDFAGDDILYIEPLNNSFEVFTFSGEYGFSANNNKDLQLFIREINDWIKKGDNGEVAYVSVANHLNKINWFNYIMLCLGFFSILLILSAYSVTASSKKKGVLKLLGWSNYAILWQFFIKEKLFISAFTSTVLTIGSVCVFPHVLPSVLLLGMIVFCFVSCLDVFSTVGIYYLFNQQLQIATFLKHKNNKVLLYWLNFFLKSCLSIVVIIFFVNILVTTADLQKLLRQYQGNTITQYGVVETVLVGNDSEDLANGDQLTLVGGHFLYDVVNRQGGLYLSSSEYVTEYFGMKTNVKINPNYLKKFPIFDEYGKQIVIDEEEEDRVILLPAKNRQQAESLRQKHVQEQKENILLQQKHFPELPQTEMTDTVQVYIIQDGQDLVTLDANQPVISETQNGNYYIEVVTGKNRTFFDLDALGSGIESPLKIKMQGDGKETFSLLEDALEQYQLSDNIKNIISIQDSIANKMYEYRIILLISFGALVLLISALVFLIVQSCLLYFNANAQSLSVKKLLGYSFIGLYNKILFINYFIYVIVFIVFLFAGRENIYYFCLTTATVALVDYVFFYLYLKRSDLKKINQQLKGGGL